MLILNYVSGWIFICHTLSISEFRNVTDGSHDLWLLCALWLNNDSVNMIGVRDRDPCKSVWDLLPKPMRAIGIDSNMSVVLQCRFRACNHASPVCTSPYLELDGLFSSMSPLNMLYPSAKKSSVNCRSTSWLSLAWYQTQLSKYYYYEVSPYNYSVLKILFYTLIQ
jgi:hypothetical protein